MIRQLGVLRLGLMKYIEALAIQEQIANKLKSGFPLSGVLILVEHPHVYTVGIRKNALSEEEKEKLLKLGADVAYVGRGGLITYHGPGQLVAWPVLNLRSAPIHTVRLHVRGLEQVILNMCYKLKIYHARRHPDYPGVWLDDTKLCAVGVRASRFITTHGLALNICTDLSWFDHIIPCGIPDKGITSLSNELCRNVPVEEAIPIFLKCFSEIYACKFVEISIKELDDM